MARPIDDLHDHELNICCPYCCVISRDIELLGKRGQSDKPLMNFQWRYTITANHRCTPKQTRIVVHIDSTVLITGNLPLRRKCRIPMDLSKTTFDASWTLTKKLSNYSEGTTETMIYYRWLVWDDVKLQWRADDQQSRPRIYTMELH